MINATTKFSVPSLEKSVCLTLTYVLITSRRSAANHCTPISQICLAARHAADCNQHLILMDSYGITSDKSRHKTASFGIKSLDSEPFSHAARHGNAKFTRLA
jgi:hypothetical protein